jgi:hypothetical protein
MQSLTRATLGGITPMLFGHLARTRGSPARLAPLSHALASEIFATLTFFIAFQTLMIATLVLTGAFPRVMSRRPDIDERESALIGRVSRLDERPL